MDSLNTAPNVLAIVSLGMALAFVLSDRRSVTSRMLACALASIAASIYVNTAWIEPVPPDELGPWAGIGALTDAAAMIFSAQWLLQIRRTIPAGDLDTRVGDWLVRIAQFWSLLYLALGVFAYQLRAEYFLTGLSDGWGLPPLEFMIFAAPLLMAMLSMAFVIRLIMFRRPEYSESVRLIGFLIGAPLIALGLVVGQDIAAYTTSVGLMILLVGAVQFHVLEGQKGAFMGRFLAPQVAELVRREGLKRTMGSDTVQLSVVACDVRGFTGYAEAIPSERVIRGLRSYYDRVGEIAARHGTTIKDYAGDGVLMLVGAPLPCDNHAQIAVALARDLQREIAPMLEQWSLAHHQLGFGIGVATGEATVGIVGGASRLEYAAVGAVVNRAARLCDAARSGEALLDAATHAEIQPQHQYSLRDSGQRQLKGIDTPVATYAIHRA